MASLIQTMNHLYDAKQLDLAINGYFHDTFKFDSTYFYDGYKIVWVEDFITESQEHLFMNLVPKDVIQSIALFYRKRDIWDLQQTHHLFKIDGEANEFLIYDHQKDVQQNMLNNNMNRFHQSINDQGIWRHAFGVDIVPPAAKKIWKFRLCDNIEQV